MTATVVPLEGDRHQAVQRLLPWYLHGQLDDAERAMVDAHLPTCPRCQDELAWQQRLYAACAATGDAAIADVEPGLARLRARIDAGHARPARPATTAAPRPPVGRRRASWVPWLLAGQLAAIVLLAVTVALPPRPADRYHTLGAASRVGLANAVVRFSADATEREIRQALQAAGARLVDGPTASGAYLINVPTAQQAAALEALRARPVIELAESLDAGPRP